MYPILWTFLFFGLAVVVATLEIFLPTAGIFGALAVILLITSMWFSFQVSIVFGSIYTFVVCLLIPIFLWGALRLWPQTWIGRQILLTPENDPALTPNEELETLKRLVGKYGLATSKMLLGGQIEVENIRYSAISESEMIDKGEPVSVLRIEGSSIIVRKMSPEEWTALSPHTPASPEDASLEDPFA